MQFKNDKKSNLIFPRLYTDWNSALKEEFQKGYFIDLKLFLIDEYRNNVVYPEKIDLLNAYNLTHFKDVKVVILGQDPYHGKKQAHGLCFSVTKETKIPPSLINIYKELKDDLNIPIPKHGNLESWAKQGVLLLNTTLSVRDSEPLSHQNKGWENFTDQSIIRLSEERNGLIFLLWGSHARSKKKLIDSTKHEILEAPHPSPLSAYRGFLGCKHFSKTNEFLLAKNESPINWEIN